MTSERQAEANRRTAAGKAAVARNGIKHGLLSAFEEALAA